MIGEFDHRTCQQLQRQRARPEGGLVQAATSRASSLPVSFRSALRRCFTLSAAASGFFCCNGIGCSTVMTAPDLI